MVLADFFSQIRWRPGIGDPSFMGWFTVVAYGVAAVLAVLVARRTPLHQVLDAGPKVRVLWFAVALVMGGLCINKQLDLQSLFTDLGRVLARQEGWYAARRDVQKLFVYGVLIGAVSVAGWVGWRLRGFWVNHKLLLVGLGFTLTFVVVRAVSFHHIDEFLGSRKVGVKMNWLLELTGIFLVTLATWLELRKLQRRK